MRFKLRFIPEYEMKNNMYNMNQQNYYFVQQKLAALLRASNHKRVP